MTQPEQVKIAIKRPDGGVTIMAFITTSYRGMNPDGTPHVEFTRPATPENIEAEISRARLSMTSWRIINDAEVPPDRTFRDAWTDSGVEISEHMGKARAIHLARLRRARDRKLNAPDKAWMRASGQGNEAEVAAIEAQRQALRDLPQTVAAALTAAKDRQDLKAVWPANLD